ncbi:hypothetical protein ACET3Z_001349 [Daucus carota]
MPESPPVSSPAPAGDSRKEKRKALKKEKRKQLRKELAEKARLAEEARLNDPEHQKQIQLEEERERERLERERLEFEERERLFLEALAKKQAQEEEEEEERRRALEEEAEQSKKNQEENEPNEDDDWEYVEEGPPEIIWQGNEIIVKKNRVKVKKKDSDRHIEKVDADRPTSNPLPPQSEAFADYKNAPPISAQQLLENVAQQVPNFGTEQDKAHCPFHIKTGACRFGSRCSRVHFYPDRSCTLLMKNMYNGPGLAWEQDEGLEDTDEEVERSYEEFYEDVHTEFLKYGEIVNFKVCKNGAFHLRGNLYVHYKSLDSAVMAYQAMNGRYFAGKQVNCEFVGVTRWKIAICGEFMKTRLKTCTRGTACNFIHCFRNPGGDYEWADWDKPPPRFWVKKMIALFGNSDETRCDKQMEEEHLRKPRKSSRQPQEDEERYRSRRSHSKESDSCRRRFSRSRYEDYDIRKSTDRHRLPSRDEGKWQRTLEEHSCKETNLTRLQHRSNRTDDSDSAGDHSDIERNTETFQGRTRKGSRSLRSKVKELGGYSKGRRKRTRETDTDGDSSDCDTGREKKHDIKLNHKSLTTKCTTEHKFKDVRSSRTHENSYDGDLSDSDIKIGRHRGPKNKSSSHSKEVSKVLDDFGNSRSGSHVTDSGEWSDEGRDKHRQRKGSRSRKKASAIHEHTRSRESETRATNCRAVLLEEERYRPEESPEERYWPDD